MNRAPGRGAVPSASIIALEHVSKSFDGGRTFAVRDVNLTVREGELVAVVGGSGSGKTTTLKTINRLIDPDTGSVRVSGEPVHAVPAALLRRKIGYVFQGIGLFPHMTVGENIAVVPQLLGWPAEQIAARTAALMDLVALPRSCLQRLPAELSGGQQQRVGVARALAAKPAIMLMDEPFGALDPITRNALGTEYRRLHEEMGLTTLMVTHDILEAFLLADRIIMMRDGCVVADGTPHHLASHPDPRVRALVDVPRRQSERVRDLMNAEPVHE